MKNLTPFDLWMVKSNLQTIRDGKQAADDVLAILRANGYHSVAEGVASALKETADPTAIDLTPAGCRTPEGIERTHTAVERYANAKAEAANFLVNLCKDLGGGTSNHDRQALCLADVLNVRGIGCDAETLAGILKEHFYAQEELLRAAGGVPKLKEPV